MLYKYILGVLKSVKVLGTQNMTNSNAELTKKHNAVVRVSLRQSAAELFAKNSVFRQKCLLPCGQSWWNFFWQYISGRPTTVPILKFLALYLLKLSIFKILRTLFRGLYCGQIWWKKIWQYISGSPTKVPNFKFIALYLLKLSTYKVLRTLFRGPEKCSNFFHPSYATIYTFTFKTHGRITLHLLLFSQSKHCKIRKIASIPIYLSVTKPQGL